MENSTPKTKHGFPGLLIVIEGMDSSGRTTQVELLKEWLAVESYGVMVSQWKTSKLMSKVIDKAKNEKNLMNANTFSLLYASDFADRVEKTVIPALKAGMAVIMDRYTYTAFARDVVRGVEKNWVRNLYDFAPEPDIVFYLETPVECILKRIISTTGLDFYESGRDIGLSTDFYESFKIYQNKILDEFDDLKKEFDYIISIDGTQKPEAIHGIMKSKIKDSLSEGIMQ